MANGTPQNSWRIALDYNCVEIQTRNLNFTHNIPDPQPLRSERGLRVFGLALNCRGFESQHFVLLIHIRLCNNVSHIGKREHTTNHENPRYEKKDAVPSPTALNRRCEDADHAGPLDVEADDFSPETEYPGRVRTCSLPRPGAETFTNTFLNSLELTFFSGAYPIVYCWRRSRAIRFEVSVTVSSQRGKKASPPVSLQRRSRTLGLSSSPDSPTKPIE